MSKFKDQRPEFESMNKNKIIKILDSFRSYLKCCENSDDFCMYVGEILKVDTKSGSYGEDEEE